jgi:hypothetical protein
MRGERMSKLTKTSKDYAFVCPHGEDIDEFAIFANVLSEDKATVTIERATKFGELKHKDVTLPKKVFQEYYLPVKQFEKKAERGVERE